MIWWIFRAVWFHIHTWVGVYSMSNKAEQTREKKVIAPNHMRQAIRTILLFCVNNFEWLTIICTRALSHYRFGLPSTGRQVQRSWSHSERCRSARAMLLLKCMSYDSIRLIAIKINLVQAHHSLRFWTSQRIERRPIVGKRPAICR